MPLLHILTLSRKIWHKFLPLSQGGRGVDLYASHNIFAGQRFTHSATLSCCLTWL